jgi:hypothetical protein
LGRWEVSMDDLLALSAISAAIEGALESAATMNRHSRCLKDTQSSSPKTREAINNSAAITTSERI